MKQTINAQRMSLLARPQFGLRVRVAREVNYQFENERKQWKEEMKKYRTQHAEQFWNTQTQAENMWIQKYKQERHAKQISEMDRFRNNIARISLHTKNKLEHLEKQKTKTIEKMRMRDIQNMKKFTAKKLMLDAMQI